MRLQLWEISNTGIFFWHQGQFWRRSPHPDNQNLPVAFKGPLSRFVSHLLLLSFFLCPLPILSALSPCFRKKGTTWRDMSSNTPHRPRFNPTFMSPFQGAVRAFQSRKIIPLHIKLNILFCIQSGKWKPW